MKSKRRIFISAAAAFVLGVTLISHHAYAAPILAGPSGSPGVPIVYNPDPSNTIGTNPNPIQLSYSAGGGPWVKEFQSSFPTPQPSSLIFAGEIIQVTGAVSWAGWYEEIITPNWIFQSSNISILAAGGSPSGLSISLASDGRSFLATFAPISPGIILSINYPLIYTAGGQLSTAPYWGFQAYPIAASSAVCEPTGILLLGIGLLGIAGAAGRRSKG